MTLGNIVLQKLSETPAASERHEFGVTDNDSGWSLYLTAERRDRWTTVAWEMALRRGVPGGAVAPWAERVTQLASGLLEPLGVIEVDNSANQALIRSSPPTEADGKISYYEVVLQGV